LLARTIRQLGLGALGGVLVAVLVVRLMEVIPFDVPRGDVWLLVMMTVVLIGAGTLACAAPLKRALELRPLDWLRDA
jgi:ABC-type lipoprotein release transport system permease subunit